MKEDPQSIRRLGRLLDLYGYDFLWYPDNHVLWKDCFQYLALYATNTSRVRLGTGVTNLLTRHPLVVASSICTLNLVSNGRAVLGLGRGDSAARIMGDETMPLGDFMKRTADVKTLCSGEEISCNGEPVKLSWTKGRVPLYLAAYGPKMLRFAGRVADGVILQVGEPNIIKWMVDQIRVGAELADRSIDDIDICAFTALSISDDLDEARDKARYYPAVVSNHVFDLMKRYDVSALPSELVRDMEAMRGKYDYLEHGQVGAKHEAYVTENMIDRLAIVGTPEGCVDKIRELANAGVTQVTFYMVSPEDVDHTLKITGEQIIPRFR